MKKVLAVVMILCLMTSLSALAADSVNVYVTIADNNGNLAVAGEKVSVTDLDGDGLLTITDALAAAHNDHYPGGADVGYGCEKTEFGASMTMLWGYDNGSGYGYQLNNGSAWNMLDPIKEGDIVCAFVYTDTITWADTYCYFDALYVDAATGEQVELTLSAAGFDQQYNPITVPVADAAITVDGKTTQYKTDEDGKVTLTLDAGSYLVSAASDTMTLVPPVCRLTVTATEAPTEAPTEAITEPTTEPVTDDVPATGSPAGMLMTLCALSGGLLILLGSTQHKRKN